MAGALQVLKAAKTDTGFLVRVMGRGTLRESPVLLEFTEKCFEDNEVQVVVNLIDCEHLDSTFLGCLLILHRKYCSDSPRFVITADQTTKERLFGPTQLDQVLHCEDSAPQSNSEELNLGLPNTEPRQCGVHIMETHRELAKLGGKSASQFARVADQIAIELGKGS